ncbi:MAG: alpha/beta hydrolase [Betaproteobacteria bacterium]|jgi:pimeloyl-ACP methyl ester carboxylesterase|nr:alpha/beta hydrolase [Betaproteobacteria bacterium]NBP44004.1 alpha/beta hydrolase [Betaproteobacteria bacterium]
MELQVNQRTVYAYTGGKAFRADQPTVVFVHGVLNDHSVWILQSRYLANHGWNVLAVDLPGHMRSQGPCPRSVQEAADWLAAVLDAAGLAQAAVVGHSWGSLIGLETAARHPLRVSHLAMVGTAYPMKVSDVLLRDSVDNPEAAIHLINVFSRSTLCAPPSALGPGTWVFGANRALNRRVMRANPHEPVFHLGFKACNDYANGLQAMAKVTCPVLFIHGEQDQMTPPRAAKELVQTAKAHAPAVSEVTVPCGHHQMNESPRETLHALCDFLGTRPRS